IPSLCSGGTPETSHSSTRLFVSLSKHMAKFRIPTSILRIINLKDLYIFNLKLFHATQTSGTRRTQVTRSLLTSWRETHDYEKNNKSNATDNRSNGGIFQWTGECIKNTRNCITNGTYEIGETIAF